MTTGNIDFMDVACLDGFKVLKLPYKPGADPWTRYSMFVFLPDARDGLSTMVDVVTASPAYLGGDEGCNTMPGYSGRRPGYSGQGVSSSYNFYSLGPTIIKTGISPSLSLPPSQLTLPLPLTCTLSLSLMSSLSL